MNYFLAIFCILHGLVHLLYMGHALNYFELEKGFTWPEKSALPGRIFSSRTNKYIAGILCIAAAMGFIVAGFGILSGYSRDNMAILFAIGTSTFLFIAFWDGSLRKLHTQGGIAILINLLILTYILIGA